MEAKKIAIPIHNERVSPLFDVAGRFILVNTDDPEIKYFLDTANDSGMSIIERLDGSGVNIVICSAISMIYARAFEGKRIELIAGIIGLVDEIIDAYLNNQLSADRFIMPGCAFQKRHRGGKGRCRGLRDSSSNDKWREKQ